EHRRCGHPHPGGHEPTRQYRDRARDHDGAGRRNGARRARGVAEPGRHAQPDHLQIGTERMITRIRELRLRLRSDDDGIAMVTVIAVTAVLTMFVVAGVAFSLGTLDKSRNDQDWNGAL